jgi:hypothetical protein
LYRARRDRRGGERRPVPAGPGDVIVRAQLEQQRELLTEHGVVVGHADAEDLERLRERAAAGDDLGPTVADQVEGREVLVDPDRVEHAEHGDRAGAPDGAGAGGDRGQYDGRRRPGEVQRVVLTEREQVQPQLLGQGRVADDLVHPAARRVRPPAVRIDLDVAERQDPQFHGAPPQKE